MPFLKKYLLKIKGKYILVFPPKYKILCMDFVNKIELVF